jgi:hypothetical protein
MSEVLNLKLPVHLKTQDQRREWIFALEETIANTEESVHGDSELCPLNHRFADGCYVREIFIPAGTMVVGKIHKHVHPNFLMVGKISMITEEGGLIQMEAPQSLISPAGCKRAIYCHTDTVWVTVHVTESQNLLEIEEQTIAPTYESFLEFKEKKCLG